MRLFDEKRMARFFPIALFLQPQDLGQCLTDQGGFVMGREEWEEMKAEVNLFFSGNPDADIEAHNAERYSALEDERKSKGIPLKQTPPPKPGYIYLIYGNGTQWYKIGQSVNPDVRQKQLGTQGPFECVLMRKIAVRDMAATEQVLHNIFADKRVGGEWFNLSLGDVNWLMQTKATTPAQFEAEAVSDD